MSDKESSKISRNIVSNELARAESHLWLSGMETNDKLTVEARLLEQ